MPQMIDFPRNSDDQVRFLTIDAERAGQRIDNYLLAVLKGVPKTLIYKILRKGEVRVNKGRVKPTYRLQTGDVVRVPPLRLSAPKTAEPPDSVLKRLADSVIYEDDGLLIINKPSGIAVHGGSGLSYGVIEGLRKLYAAQHLQLELVHRLDRDTSGCLVIAKKRSALRRMHELMRENKVCKRYAALCKGHWRGDERRIDAPLAKFERSGERMVHVSAGGKDAASIFRVRSRFENATLLEVELITGRTHQIRVHSLHAGHPLAGDDKYGDPDFNQAMKAFGLRRLFLHAASLRFPWGDDGRALQIEAPLPEALQQVLAALPAGR